jgi:general secretion pathway protein G
MSAHAFTLVEILIVVIILGILAAIVVPQFSDASQESTASTLKSIIATLRDRIQIEYHRAIPPAYPATIDNAWLAVGSALKHPGNDFGEPNVQVESNASAAHPTNKVLKAGVGGAFWYNAANGEFRARVTDQGSEAATLAHYNDINQSSESSLGNYGGGGGWS